MPSTVGARTLDAESDALPLEGADPGLAALLDEVRGRSAALRRREAEHVRAALRDPAFPFAAAQAELATAREQFAELCRQVVRDRRGLEPRARREVLDLAYLIKCAPLTDEEDLRALRRARQERARANRASG